jgi:hypothetical protein
MVYAQVGWATAVAVVSMLGQFLQGAFLVTVFHVNFEDIYI